MMTARSSSLASQFHHFLGAVRHPLIAVDRDGVVTDCNEVAAACLGSSSASVHGTPLWESVHPDDVTALRHTVAQVFETRDPGHVRFRVQDQNGRWRTLDAVMQMIGTESNVASVSAVEVTPESGAAAETSQQTSALETLGRLAGGVSHDFANLLMVIAGESAHMLEALGTESPLAPHVHTIRTAADRASGLVRHLLSVSKPYADAPTLLDVQEIVDGMKSIVQRLVGEHIEVEVTTEPNLWAVSAHRVQIERVLLNLSVNARDAMPNGGRLTIQASNMTAAGLSAEGVAGVDAAVAISVTDDGVGMDSDTLTRAFDPFFTTKRDGGTGLGLATVKAAITEAGGWTRIKSAPGKGTTITVLLPRAEGAIKTEPRQANVVGGTETILLVEDEVSVLNVVRDMLESAGYRVLTTSSPESLEAVVGAHTGPVHLLLTDVVLPEMSGLDIADRLRQRYPGLPVLFMSGYAEPAFADGRSGDLGPHFIAKPFDRQKLLRAVRRAIDSVSLGSGYLQRESAAG